MASMTKQEKINQLKIKYEITDDTTSADMDGMIPPTEISRGNIFDRIRGEKKTAELLQVSADKYDADHAIWVANGKNPEDLTTMNGVTGYEVVVND